jgi:flagellar hook-basal body complex protein FliE
MTQQAANNIAQMYMQAGYTTHGAFLAMSKADMQFLEIVQVIDTMQAMGVE